MKCWRVDLRIAAKSMTVLHDAVIEASRQRKRTRALDIIQQEADEVRESANKEYGSYGVAQVETLTGELKQVNKVLGSDL